MIRSSLPLSRRQLITRIGFLSAGLTVVPLLQGCGSGDAQGEQDAEPVIEMTDEMQFVPEHLTIRASQTVTWRNVGTMVHTSTSDPAQAQDPAHGVVPDGATPWDSGLIREGASWSVTLEVPGEYAYYCLPHEAAEMIGTLTVTE